MKQKGIRSDMMMIDESRKQDRRWSHPNLDSLVHSSPYYCKIISVMAEVIKHAINCSQLFEQNCIVTSARSSSSLWLFQCQAIPKHMSNQRLFVIMGRDCLELADEQTELMDGQEVSILSSSSFMPRNIISEYGRQTETQTQTHRKIAQS